ncbi:MAG TPA: TMEM175 family protein [Solirubrobacteraceae bacterium]|nr:TMEM175 family protein [Solirubrobacteraceae bacterium]
MGTNRLEAFSDGVIAVAITLLVLQIGVPPTPPAGTKPSHHLIYQLGQLWPHYAAYVTSFLTIGIIWINHHAMIGRLREADHSILILNLLLLMSIGVLPFATDLIATYLREPQGESVAAAVYSGAFLVMAFFFGLLNRHILLNRSHLLSREMPEDERRRIYSRAAAGLVPYVLATVLAFVSPYLTLAICASVAAYYALPIASGLHRPS